MIEHLCHRCGYNTYKKSNIITHLNRKKICKPILCDVSIEEIQKHYNFEIKSIPQNTTLFPQKSSLFPQKSSLFPQKSSLLLKNCLTCVYCNKICSRSDNFKRHEKTCKLKKKSEELILLESTKLIEKDKEIELLKKQMVIQTNINNSNNTNNTNNTNTNNNINNSKNIIINNYGDENINHLKYKDYVDILSTKYMCVPNLIEKIHFDSEYPENQNIKYTNKKLPYLKVMKDNKWQLVNKKNELLNLIDDKCFLLKEKYYKILEKKKYNITEHQKEKIEEIMEKYKEDDKIVMLDLIERTELMLLNKS